MRKIMMLGQFNSLTQNIYRSLMNRFHVQFCPPDEELLSQMYPMLMPELVFISLVGMSEEHRSILVWLTENCPTTPAICVGNREELDIFEQELSGQQFVRMIRPVTIRDMIEKIYSQLGISMDKAASINRRNRRRRILLIDDSAIQLRTMRELLKREYDVDMAKSGQEAMNRIRTHMPDMIFLDYDMPGCDGRMTFEMIKNEPAFSDIPVVFLTGVGDRKKVLSVLSMYPADYLLKPVDQGKIVETIKDIIGE